jgi:beta-lactamase regulating signal transducer with metallopeptidase domain
MTLPQIQLLAQLVAEGAVNSIAGGLLIAAFAWLLLRVVGKQNAGTRFVVWFSALIAIAALPFVPALSHAGTMTKAMHAEVVLPAFWAVAIFFVWILIAAVAATRVLAGLWNLRRLRASGAPLEPAQLHPALRETLAQCEAIRPVTVCSSPALSVPTAIGFFKPVILIPEWAVRDLPLEELKIIILHEFAHLRRRDDWTNLVQKLVRTAFFFHPAVWWIEKRLSLEREMACDDAVLAETNNPRAYAECLVSLAEKNFVQRSLAMAQAAISRACETTVRLARILDAETPHATRIFKPALGMMAALLAACLVMLPDAPRLIAFENVAFENDVPPGSVAAATGTLAKVIPVASRTRVDSPLAALQKAMAVPAIYRPSGNGNLRSGEAKFRPVNVRRSRPAKNLAAKKQPAQPALMAARTIAMPVAPTPEFLFVMQTANFDQQGSMVVSFTVWKVTFTGPNASRIQLNQVQQSVFAKVI